MVIGHFGFGLGAKKFAPKVSLGVLFMAVQWADLLWPTFLLTGVEHVTLQPDNRKFPYNFTDFPITHSLLMDLIWGLCFGLVYWLIKKDKQGAVVAGLCVLSHWCLDLFVHQSDLPLFPGNSPHFGFGLWNWPLLTALIEFSLFAVGLYLYISATQAKNKTGKWSLWLMVILLISAHIAGITSPPPATVSELGWGGQSYWLFIFIGFWVDRNRMVRTPK